MPDIKPAPIHHKLVVSVLGKCEVAARSRSQEDGQEEAATQARPAVSAAASAQGKGGRKRTPTSAFDPAAGAAIAAALEPEKTFTVEKLVASRLKSGVKEYLVRWEGYGDKHDSWEPMENLSNLVEEMAAFDLAKEKETCRAQQLWQQHLVQRQPARRRVHERRVDRQYHNEPLEWRRYRHALSS